MCMSQAAAGINGTSLQPIPTSGFQLLANVQGAEATIAADVTALLVSLENFALTLGKEAVVFLVIIGVLLYYTRLGTHMGKKLMEGGVVIAIFITFVVPYIAISYC